MLLQVTLTVPEAKGIIAVAAQSLPEVRRALDQGKVLLKGGTTVSILAKNIVGQGLGICGRVSPLGTKGPVSMTLDAPHSILIENRSFRDVDDSLEQAVLSLEREDVFIVGANAIDVNGNAALMAGSPLGGAPGRILGALSGEGINVLVLAGLEKLIPTSISEAANACGRKKVDLALGMAVGLIPIAGRLITEQAALEILADVRCTVIGKGGISGAEGATTMVVDGDKSALKTVFEHVKAVKERFGTTCSIEECAPGSDGCHEDLACVYRNRRLLRLLEE